MRGAYRKERKVIHINNLCKSYGEGSNSFQVLKKISLDIPDGEFLVILGPSGSGKSTLLNAISGLEPVDEEEILYQDTDITKLSDHELTLFRKEKIGFIFQQYFLLNNLTVSANVKLGADLTGNRDYLSLLDAVGLADKADAYPTELSGGQQQRVSIARALSKKPKILFLDEPTGALDEETGRQILHYITCLRKEQNLTLVMVTHNLNIADMADRVIRMNSGKIVDSQMNTTPKSAYEILW